MCVERINIPGLSVSRGGSFFSEKARRKPECSYNSHYVTLAQNVSLCPATTYEILHKDPTLCYPESGDFMHRSCITGHSSSEPDRELVWSHGSSSTDLNPCGTTTYGGSNRPVRTHAHPFGAVGGSWLPHTLSLLAFPYPNTSYPAHPFAFVIEHIDLVWIVRIEHRFR